MTWLGSHALQIEVDEKWLIYAWSYDSIPCGGAVSGISARNLKEDPQKDILIWNFGCSIFVYLEAIQADANVVVASIPMENRLEAYDLETATFTTIIDDPSYLVGDFDIWNNIVVWGQSPTDTIEYDIMEYDLTIQQPFTVSAKPGSEGDISVDNDIIVWTWNGNVYGYDLSISERFTITTESQARPLLELSGDWLVWRDDRNGEWDIYSMNIRTGQEYRVTEETGHYFNPTIDGSLIVWTAGKSPAGPFQAVRVEAVRRLDHFAFLPVVSRE
jgi:beta propeller repeat protein